MNEKGPLVSVWMIAYNHEQYIVQAIESVISQITTFDFEVVIGEDCSTDRTREICVEYQKKYPNIIRPLLHEKNVGIHKNVVMTLEACRGSYVALLECDDYWTDPNKLQKQLDFLSANPDFVMCYQKTLEINELTGLQKVTNEGDNAVTGLEEILERGWFMRTGSLFFRNGLIKEFPDWYFKYKSTDYMLQILIAQHGKVGFLNEITSVYRRHEGGITQDFGKNIIAFNEKKIQLLEVLNAYLNYRYQKQIRKQQTELRNVIFINGINRIKGLQDIIYLAKLFPRINHWLIIKRTVGFLKRRTPGA